MSYLQPHHDRGPVPLGEGEALHASFLQEFMPETKTNMKHDIRRTHSVLMTEQSTLWNRTCILTAEREVEGKQSSWNQRRHLWKTSGQKHGRSGPLRTPQDPSRPARCQQTPGGPLGALRSGWSSGTVGCIPQRLQGAGHAEREEPPNVCSSFMHTGSSEPLWGAVRAGTTRRRCGPRVSWRHHVLMSFTSFLFVHLSGFYCSGRLRYSFHLNNK